MWEGPHPKLRCACLRGRARRHDGRLHTASLFQSVTSLFSVHSESLSCPSAVHVSFLPNSSDTFKPSNASCWYPESERCRFLLRCYVSPTRPTEQFEVAACLLRAWVADLTGGLQGPAEKLQADVNAHFRNGNAALLLMKKLGIHSSKIP
jgi:hypothetical protein